MKVEKLDHIHIYVKDLDEVMKFFSRILGLTWSDIIQDDKVFGLRASISSEGLELVQGTGPESPVSQGVARRGEGLFGISLKVENLEAAVKELEAKGVRCVGRINIGKMKEAQFHPRDAHGVMIELCEYPDIHAGAQVALGR